MGLFDRLKKAFHKEKGETVANETEEKEELATEDEHTEESAQEEQNQEADNQELNNEESADQPVENQPEEVVEEVVTEEEPVAEIDEIEPEEVEDSTVEITEAGDTVTEKEEVSEESEESANEEPETTETESVIKVAEIDDEETTDEERYDKGLEKTRQTFGQRMNALFANFRRVDEDFFEELEDTLITSDVGFETAMRLTDELREEVKLQNAKKPKDVQNVIIEKLVNLYEEQGQNEDNALHIKKDGLSIILFVGVNGAGKTTTIGKLANQFKAQGKKVILAAADTFRAGAINQLVVWGERSGVEVVRGKEGGDPASVVFDAVKKAKEEQADILLVDTAGRLQNKVNLMNELEKIKRIIQREEPDAPQEVLLVLDATTGQNAMSQAKQFKEVTDVTGLVLTKLDGTAKGGIILAIRNELHIPVKLVGLGEGINDLATFDAEQFAYGLFKGLWTD